MCRLKIIRNPNGKKSNKNGEDEAEGESELRSNGRKIVRSDRQKNVNEVKSRKKKLIILN